MMSPRTKSFLALGATLLLGMVLGGLLTGAIIKKRAGGFMMMMRNENSFVSRFEEILDLTPEQKNTLRPILLQHGRVMTARSREFTMAQGRTFDSLQTAMLPLLTEAQKERFQQSLERFNKRRKHWNSGSGDTTTPSR